MALYEFTGGDARDYFHHGRVNPGDVVEHSVPPDIHWRPVGALPVAAEPANDVPDSAVDDVPAAPTSNEEVV